MGTPKRFQLATLWDNDAGFHTNEGSKIPPERYLNAPHHQPHRLHTLQCTDMRYMCIKTHFLLCEFIAHVLHNVSESQFPTAGDSGCCQSVCGAVNPKIIPWKTNTLPLARSRTRTYTHVPQRLGECRFSYLSLEVAWFEAALRLTRPWEQQRGRERPPSVVARQDDG